MKLFENAWNYRRLRLLTAGQLWKNDFKGYAFLHLSHNDVNIQKVYESYNRYLLLLLIIPIQNRVPIFQEMQVRLWIKVGVKIKTTLLTMSLVKI